MSEQKICIRVRDSRVEWWGGYQKQDYMDALGIRFETDKRATVLESVLVYHISIQSAPTHQFNHFHLQFKEDIIWEHVRHGDFACNSLSHRNQTVESGTSQHRGKL